MNPQNTAWHTINNAKVKKQITNSSNMSDLALRIVELLDKNITPGKILQCGLEKDKKSLVLTVRFAA